jgi:hypothetical protein
MVRWNICPLQLVSQFLIKISVCIYVFYFNYGFKLLCINFVFLIIYMLNCFIV